MKLPLPQEHSAASRAEAAGAGLWRSIRMAGRWLPAPNHVLRHRRLSDVDAEHLQLAVNSRCTPANVISRHAPNELADALDDLLTAVAQGQDADARGDVVRTVLRPQKEQHVAGLDAPLEEQDHARDEVLGDVLHREADADGEDGPGREQGGEVDAEGVIDQVGVHIKITHDYPGDLTVRIVHPDGTEALLHNHSGSSTNDIDQIYGLGGVENSDLDAFKGKPASGTWKLVVKDHASSDEGTLEYVKLAIKGYLD